MFVMELLPCLLSTLRKVDPVALDQDYNVVRSKSSIAKKSLSTEAGAQKENIKKNRYKDILPYDVTRVVLSLQTALTDSDYINASFIKGATADKTYIAAQAPLSSTVTDFWRMIWQHDVKVIVMACREIEMGKRKCECYWAAVHQSASFGPFTVCSQGETRPNEDMVIRTLTVTYQQDSRSVTQYQFLSWPDHDVPYEAAGVLDLLQKARTSLGTHNAPLLIHCSAGCGRTGVICALDYIHDLVVTKQITADFNIMRIVLELRRQRPSAVQTKEQYRFIFTATTCMFQRFLQSDSSQLYSNISELKKPRPERRISSTSSAKRNSQQTDMNDTYAVVNKPKQPHPPVTSPTYSQVVPPRDVNRSRTTPTSHHYDNDAGATAGPIYSTVKPRSKPPSMPQSAKHIYDTAIPSNGRQGEGPVSLGNNAEYHLVAADRVSQQTMIMKTFHPQ
ncbi:tyrosine-protein phosphatase non-receptor type 18 [Sphaeramia orbicularis]|uniref:tyrosine-protein phosphatase non-receptor type 18 n=1 Tax=Sphaeramia orbicularis TaxID=375764 RepID=UPI00117EF9E5|nr:tyrosine-protein phosphatase non-receptor type 18-like [Sphaeramia orbicularis]